MPGPGKYDPECTTARESVSAAGCVLIVIDGNRGSGFSVQAPLSALKALPNVLRSVAQQIDREVNQGASDGP